MAIQLKLAARHEFACQDALYDIIRNSGFRDKREMKCQHGISMNCIFSRLYQYMAAPARLPGKFTFSLGLKIYPSGWHTS
jgi:hypothetical protein